MTGWSASPQLEAVTLQLIVAEPVVAAAQQTLTWAADLKPDSDQVAAAAVACTAAAAAAAMACVAAAVA